MKKLKLSDFDFNTNYGVAMYFEIDTLKFVKDENFPWVEVFILDGEQYMLIDEIDTSPITTIEDLNKIAVKWLFNNIEIDHSLGEKEVQS